MAADKRACIDNAEPPTLGKGARINGGQFARNLKDNEVKKRYARDGDPPALGHRLRPDKWRWQPREGDTTDGLSVNSFACIKTAKCSVLLHPEPDMFQHVAVIDLAALSQAINLPIEAVYDPDPDGFENPCHFNLVPLGKTVEDLLVAIKRWNESACKSGDKLPHASQDLTRAQVERDAYERVFQVHLDVSAPPNEGSPSEES